MKSLFSLVLVSGLLFSLSLSSLMAQEDGIKVLTVESFAVGSGVKIVGDLSEGFALPDLRWAANSSVACFPGTRAIEFMGNQVFYQVEIPRGAELIATVSPTNKKRINLYGYLNFDGSNTPPIQRCISCEAGYPLYAGTPNLKAAGKPQSISFGQAVNRGFTVLIAVSGAKDVTEGGYELVLQLKPR